jgi:hypothetical protein
MGTVPPEDIPTVIAGDALFEVEARWARAVKDRDVAAAEQILGEDFVLTSEGGVSDLMPRADWIAALGAIETRELTCDVLQVRLFEETAVVRARLRWDARMGDRDLSGDYAVADVFRYVDGRWLASWRISVRLG